MSENSSIAPHLPLVFIICEVLKELMEQSMPPETPARQMQVVYMEFGLHSTPKKLARTLQEKLESIREPSLVALGYGLCGNGLNGLQAGHHTLFIPRVHDCMSIFLGSRQAYQQQIEIASGTYSLNRGWLEHASTPLSEYHNYRQKFGEEQALWLVDVQYHNYERLALVASSAEEMQQCRPQAQAVARFCQQRWNMRYEEIIGSNALMRRFIQAALCRHLDAGNDFLLIPPGGQIRVEDFFD